MRLKEQGYDFRGIDDVNFNPTIVRLKAWKEPQDQMEKINFNPTIVRLKAYYV